MKLVLFFLLVSIAIGAPTFDDYRTPTPLFSLREVDLTSHPKARRFRTVLREAARTGPNFAGHFVVARWGCGTGCVEWAIVDLRTGRVFFDEKLQHLLWVVGWDTDEEFLSFRPDSALLIACGATNELPDKVRRYHLHWTGTELRLLSTDTVFEAKANKAPEPTAMSVTERAVHAPCRP